MFEKDLKIGFLLDFYGDVLSERKRTVMAYYYYDDLSLGEIAEEIGISRQGVRDLIKKAEEELCFYEEKLGLASRFQRIQKKAEELLIELNKTEAEEPVRQIVKELAEAVRS